MMLAVIPLSGANSASMGFAELWEKAKKHLFCMGECATL